MLTEKQKQDCETNAFKRMIKHIKRIILNISSLLLEMVFMLLLQLLNYVKSIIGIIFLI